MNFLDVNRNGLVIKQDNKEIQDGIYRQYSNTLLVLVLEHCIVWLACFHMLVSIKRYLRARVDKNGLRILLNPMKFILVKKP